MAEKPLWKRPWEEVIFYHQFKRVPTPGWLKTGDTIGSIYSVKVYDDDGIEKVGAILNSSILDDTKVGYLVGPILDVGLYETRIRIISSSGEKFEDHAALEVIST